MEKKTGTAETGRIVLLLMLLTVIAAVFTMRLRNDLEGIGIQIDGYIAGINSRKDELAGLNDTFDELNSRYETLRDIDELIRQDREDYFKEIADLEQKIVDGSSDRKIAYLTFDDGPYLLSDSFLDVLEEYDVPATFFCLMKCKETGYDEEDEIYDSIYRRIIDSGHTLGNHTATHRLGEGGVYRSAEAFMKEIKRNRDFIYDRYGYTTDIMRFPGGSSTSSLKYELVRELKEIGYGYVDWNSATGDGGAILSPDQFRDNVLNNTGGKQILVVLMHDYSRNTLKALPEIIEGLREQGYILLPLFRGSVKCRDY